MRIYAKAPFRIEFAGGGTDVPPYTDTDGGLVFNATISRYAYCTISNRTDDKVNICSLDYGIIAFVEDCGLDLIRAIVNRMKQYVDVKGIDITLYSDVPAGSGLGSSSTVCVCLVAALSEYYNLELSKREIAKLAFEIERLELGIAGGLQDQYASAFGGVNLMEFCKDMRVVVNPYNIPENILDELSIKLVLFNTNQTRMSDKILREQIGEINNRKLFYERAKLIAKTMKNAILDGEINHFGNLLDVAWVNKKRMCETITNDKIDNIYELAKLNGAVSGRIMGAGGGGHVLFFVNDLNDRIKLIKSLEDIGCTHVPFTFDKEGVTSWKTKS